MSSLQVSKQHIDTKEFNTISRENYTKFINCAIYPGGNSNIFIYDKFSNGYVFERVLIKTENGIIYLKPILPNMAQSFTPVSHYNSIHDELLKANISLFFKFRLKELIYNEQWKSLIITTNTSTYLNQFTTNLPPHIPESYSKIKPNWYYFNK